MSSDKKRSTAMDYLRENKDKSFMELPFSIPDAMLLANAIYMRFKGLVPENGNTVTFGDIDRVMDKNKVFAHPLYGPVYRKTFEEMKDSRRYSKIRLGYFREITDKTTEAQFAAVTYFLGSDRIFVVFRGTDGSLLGWKEDFNYGFLEEMPSQQLAVDYLDEIAKKTTQKMYVGGHSKGGTLSVFASAKLDQEAQERILKVFTFDGIGFKKGFIDSPGFQCIADRVIKIMPEHGFIGRLFEMEPEYKIARSSGEGFEQHDFMNWYVKNGQVVYTNAFTEKSTKSVAKFNNWISGLSEDEIENFVEVLFEILGNAGIDDVDLFFLEPSKYIGSLIKELFAIDGKRRRRFLGTVFKYLKA